MILEKARFVLGQIAHGMIRPQKEINEAVDTVFGELDKRKWTPVTERLPENLEVVNITYINREPATYYDHIKGKPMVATAVYYCKRFYWYSVACVDVLGEYGTDEWDEMDDRIEVTAWMPLPEVYEEEKKCTDSKEEMK